jgi:hypothetical protein
MSNLEILGPAGMDSVRQLTEPDGNLLGVIRSTELVDSVRAQASGDDLSVGIVGLMSCHHRPDAVLLSIFQANGSEPQLGH